MKELVSARALEMKNGNDRIRNLIVQYAAGFNIQRPLIDQMAAVFDAYYQVQLEHVDADEREKQ